MSGHKRASATDVARLAGVSQSAVSRAFTPGRAISGDMRARVERAAATLGYRPNMLARSLITRRTNMVAVMTGDIGNPQYARTVNTMSLELQRRGYHVLLLSLEEGQGVEQAVEEVLKYRVDGVLIVSATLSSEVGEACAQVGVPVVLCNRYARHANVSSVRIENRLGGRDVAQFLIDHRHRRLGFIAGTSVDPTSADREQGFNERLGELRAGNVRRVEGDFTFDGGRRAFAALWREWRPTAIFAASDLMAAGAMDAARYDFGCKVPDDVSIVGFDDLPLASWPSYDLTTVRQPVEALARRSIELLVERIEQANMAPRTELLDGQIVVRASVRVLD